MESSEEKESYEEKNYQLFLRQKKMLEDFADHGAISKEYCAQEISILIEKMHIPPDKLEG